MKALGVYRSSIYSPNSVEKDKRILDAVAEGLKNKDFAVDVISEDELYDEMHYDVVFSMARSEGAIQILSSFAKNGALVINSAIGLQNSERGKQTKEFQRLGTPMPKSEVIDYLDAVQSTLQFPLWLKRADACAQVKDDVCFVQTSEELTNALQGFKERNISSAVLSEHVVGDLVKFYGVAGTDFFSWSYPDIKKTKFGLEERNGVPKGFSFDERKLKEVADVAAKSLDILVYGGDCIILENGEFKIIDFNDWPSFSQCCDEAAKAIIECIFKLYER